MADEIRVVHGFCDVIISEFWRNLATDCKHQEREEPDLSEQYNTWSHHIRTAYAQLLHTCEEGLDSTAEQQKVWPARGHDSDHWRHLQERIACQTFAETQFVLNIAKIDICPSERIPELLSVMAPLRHMSTWYSNLIKNMRADPNSLDKTLHQLSLMAARASSVVVEEKPKERFVWRIPG
ncbi:hypothetical protein ElyMa_000413700 [Elysia marginata]|uniref:Dynein heavy chain tail domain-containing protein n=1 Tax=Elysia marginata TaxID=1093978 RepID=A0AAV4FK58_9GAST|nr:hypothetical protein ElyMa_000413700 [Elysia marginata]